MSSVALRFADYLQPLAILSIVLGFVLLRDRYDPTTISTVLLVFWLVTIQLLEFALERHRAWRLTAKEFFTDGFYVLLSSGLMILVGITVLDPMAKLGTYFGIAKWWPHSWPFLLQGLLAALIFEFCQYWIHRYEHNSFLWRLHGVHHHLTQLNTWKSSVGHPLENWVIGFTVTPLFGGTLEASLFAGTMLSVVAAFSHANIVGTPPAWYSYFFTTLSAHSLHHRVGFEETRVNFSNSLIIFDRIFGTYLAGEAAPDNIGQGRRRRLSIPEQWAFPFRPSSSVDQPLFSRPSS